MSQDQVLMAIIAAMTALLGAAGGFFAKSRLGEVLRSPSGREETAVQKMADLLDKLSNFQDKRENRLFDLQDRAMDTVGTMVLAVKEVTLAISSHESNMAERTEDLSDGQNEILACMQQVSGQLEVMGRLISDLALEIIKERSEIKQGETRGGTKDRSALSKRPAVQRP